MTTLEHLKEWFEANYLDGDKVQRGQMIASTEILDIIEHTHTQTIQSVRERVEEMKKEYSEEIHYSGGYDEYETVVYNQALTDLLKDLEAPVEGDNVN